MLLENLFRRFYRLSSGHQVVRALKIHLSHLQLSLLDNLLDPLFLLLSQGRVL